MNSPCRKRALLPSCEQCVDANPKLQHSGHGSAQMSTLHHQYCSGCHREVLSCDSSKGSSPGDAQSAWDVPKVSKEIFHHSTTLEFISQGLSGRSVGKVCAGGWGRAGRTPELSIHQSSPAPRAEALGSCLTAIPAQKAAEAAAEQRMARPDNYRNIGSSSLISVNYTGEEEDSFSFFNQVQIYP